MQRYQGHPVLTWWQGTGLGTLASGTDYIYNDHYQQIATVKAGNGLSADGHEFLITPQNTALVLAYTKATANLTSTGGPSDQTVIDGVVQEIDIHTGRVLFQWNSADHVPYSQSEQPLPASAATPWDWFHINAVHLDSDGNLLVDSRNTWTTYKVDRLSGGIIWQLGGKASSFTLQAAPGQTLNNAAEIFPWQHDPNPVGHDAYTMFDNESAGLPIPALTRRGVGHQPRRPDQARRARPDRDADPVLRSAGGPAGPLPRATGRRPPTGIGLWAGARCRTSRRFDASGRLILNAEFPAGVNSYREYEFAWPARHRGWESSHRRGHRG